jgi:hypothetical protein
MYLMDVSFLCFLTGKITRWISSGQGEEARRTEFPLTFPGKSDIDSLTLELLGGLAHPHGFLRTEHFLASLAFRAVNRQEDRTMGKKLYVGNLSYTTTREALEELFSKAGTVESVNLVTDRSTGQSRGFGFVEMASQKEADEAIRKMNGQSIDGRSILVNEARSEERRDSGRRGGGGGGGGRRH